MRLALAALALLGVAFPAGALARPVDAKAATSLVQYTGLAAMFVGSPDSYRMVRAGERPYGPGTYPEVVESSTELTVDNVAGTIVGKTVLAYRTTSHFGYHNGDYTYPGGYPGSLCTTVVRQTSVIEKTSFTPGSPAEVAGTREYTYSVVVEGLQGPGNMSDCNWDGFTIKPAWHGRWDDTFYAKGNDDPAFAGKSHLSVYGNDIYEFLGRGFAQPTQKLPWTVMLYLDGDNNLSSSITGESSGKLVQYTYAASNPAAHFVVLSADRHGNGTYYEIQPLDKPYVEGKNKWSKGPLNMADPKTLTDFVIWARTNYPADNYMLTLDDHGNGLGGGLVSETFSDDMSLASIGAAMNTITTNGQQPIDVLYLNMCLMGMVEVAHQLRGTARYVVASQNESWEFPINTDSVYLKTIGPTTTGLQLSQAIASNYVHDGDYYDDPYTIAVWDMSRLDPLVAALNALAGGLNPWIAAKDARVPLFLDLTQRFDSNGDGAIDANDTYADVGDIANELLSSPLAFDPAVGDSARAINTALGAFVVQEAHRDGRNRFYTPLLKFGRSHGVSVFWPSTSSSFYSSTNYSFAAGATWKPSAARAAADAPAWGPMLVNYVQAYHPNSPDNPTPPKPIARTVRFLVLLPTAPRDRHR